MNDVQREIKRLGSGADRDEIYGAMQVLCRIGGRALPSLIRILLDQGERYIVRCRVADTLGMLGDRKAVEPLVTILSDSDVQVRWHAIRALAELGARSALPQLRRLAISDDGEFSITPTLRISMKEEARKAIEQIESAAKR